MKKRKYKIRYISVKLPASAEFYPVDKFGCCKFPDYTKEYLKKHGRKLADILHNKIPADVCLEVIRILKEKEDL